MRFSWDNYDCSFLVSILRNADLTDNQRKRLERNLDDSTMLANIMNAVYPSLDAHFVKANRSIIEQELLKAYPDEIKKICQAEGIKGRSENDRQLNLSKTRMTLSLANNYVRAIENIGGSIIPIDKYSKFKNTVILDMKSFPVPDVPLYDYQRNAVTALMRFYIDEDQNSGILVMPTGSGKSRTAITFLIREMISRGYQILWIAHRYMLLDQAAECFYDFSGLAKIEKPDIKKYTINCISGEHLRCSQVKKGEVVIASIASICRNQEHLKRFLGRKVMVVVDECHHTFAPSYRDVISFIRKHRSNVKLLGLTATPVRANDEDSLTLLKLYDNNIIYSIAMSELISKGILAKPIFKRVETNTDFEPSISQSEARLINHYGELPATLTGRIARSRARNNVIVKEYLKHKKEYGKTLIFALDVVHCRLLCHDLRKAGVKCNAIYNGNEENESIIKAFKKGELDVLVNVNIMTEGSDVPDIKTVMLTRPTSSEGFLIQMIGRGMRGVAAKGTEICNIVDFHDKWEIFNKWLNPKWIIDAEIDDDQKTGKKKYHKRNYILYDWKLCLSAYKALVKTEFKYASNVAIPSAWYALYDEEGEPYNLIIFEDQLSGYISMRKDKDAWIDGNMGTDEILHKYFSYFCNRPTIQDIEMFVYNFRNNEELPQLYLFKDRTKVEPRNVAQEIKDNNLDLIKTAKEIYDQYDIAQEIYETEEDYIRAIEIALKVDSDDAVGYRVEEIPLEFVPYELDNAHDLKKLAQDVVDEMFDGKYPDISSIEWTDRPQTSKYGAFYYRDNSIKINCVLNSSKVDPEVIKYLIYHEMLHRKIQNHSPEFRELEHKYPNYAELDSFLDCDFEMYEISKR